MFASRPSQSKKQTNGDDESVNSIAVQSAAPSELAYDARGRVAVPDEIEYEAPNKYNTNLECDRGDRDPLGQHATTKLSKSDETGSLTEPGCLLSGLADMQSLLLKLNGATIRDSNVSLS